MAPERKTWSFRPRWRIRGLLHTQSPLFVGSGDTFEHPEIKKDDGTRAEVLAFTRAGNTPFIPGTTLKGYLRSRIWQLAQGNKEVEKLVEAVFGKGPGKEANRNQGQGGKARFHDALLISRRVEPTPLPYWNPETQTFIEAHNCLDRVTKTVAEKMLFYQETVPAGVGFAVEITGKFGPEDTLAEKEVALLLASLEWFSGKAEEEGLSLGADTATGKGRLLWELEEVSVIEESDVKGWLATPRSRPFYRELYRPIGPDREKGLLSAGRALLRPGPKENITIPVVIRFDSHFLVNDPPSPPEAEKKKKDLESEIADHRPLRDEQGQAVLPASSVRGALRSQAERIIRTLGGKACHPGTPGACRSTVPRRDYKDLCPACRAFGAPGWRSPVRISNFRLVESRGETTQELLAIDRFTGGGKHGAKFNVQAVYQPVFKGEVEIELGRLAQVEANDPPGEGNWVLGLLALLLRDLKEGDITFGFGASKGYGSCTAEIGCWDDEGFRKKARTGLDNFRKMVQKQGGDDG